MIPAAPAMTEATTTAVTARRAAFPAELLDRIPFFMIFLSLWLTLLVLETPMTRVHSRPEATELRSCWEWLLCTNDGELEAATRPRYHLVGEPDRSLGLARNDDLVGWDVRRASWIACSGSVSPTRPRALTPLRSKRSSHAATRSCARLRAASSSDTQRRSHEFSAGA